MFVHGLATHPAPAQRKRSALENRYILTAVEKNQELSRKNEKLEKTGLDR